jgi:hypothetical protein
MLIPYLFISLFNLGVDFCNSFSECDIITWSSVKRSVFRHLFLEI